MFNFYQEENRQLNYAIVFLLFALCLLQVSNNVQSLFPRPDSSFSLVGVEERN